MIEVFIPDYIIQILNSQHGWISIVIINNQCYDWGIQSRFSATAIILLMDMFYSTMEGIVPSHCRLTSRHLGATLFKLGLHQIHKSHVAASMHHDTWGLMQSHFFAHLIEDPTHHIVMSRPLEATNCSCQNSRYTSLIPLYGRIHCSVGKAQSS